VIALIGEVASSRSLAAAPIAQSNGVPMISPSSTNPEVTKKGDFIFRACFLDEFQGRVMARYAADSLKFKRVAILKDIKNDYSVGLSQFFSEEYKARGGSIVGEQAYNEGDSTSVRSLTALKANNFRGDLRARLLPRSARSRGRRASSASRRRSSAATAGLGPAAQDRRRRAQRVVLLEPLRAGPAEPGCRILHRLQDEVRLEP
jgi:hypothetical protein